MSIPKLLTFKYYDVTKKNSALLSNVKFVFLQVVPELS